MVTPMRHYLVKGIATAGCVFSLVLLQENPISRNPGLDDEGVGIILPLADIVF
jgi:hypothetical protein